MKYIPVGALFLVLVFGTSCEGQNKTDLSKENTKSATKERVFSTESDDPNFHTKYEYTDAVGKHLIIENCFPRGGSRYTAPNGEVYAYAVFWTRIINETDHPLELKIDFLDSYEVPSAPGKYFKLSVPPDTMTLDKEGLFNYGLTNLESFLDKSIHKPSSLKRTINPKESSDFYVLKLGLVTEGSRDVDGGDILRTGLILKGQDLFYRVSVYNRQAPPSIIGEEEISCGSINLKNLVLQQ
ncbi:MAG: hypothetical protein RIG62_27595 [Cyclobacteriaceae bacterium]